MVRREGRIETAQEYKCWACHTIADSDEIEELTAYKCPSCDELYEYKDEARDCHGEESADGV